MERKEISETNKVHASNRELATINYIKNIVLSQVSASVKEAKLIHLHEILKAERKSLSANPNADQRSKDENIRLSLIVARNIKALQILRQEKSARFKNSNPAPEQEAKETAQKFTQDSEDSPKQEKTKARGSRKQYITTMLSSTSKKIDNLTDVVRLSLEDKKRNMTARYNRAVSDTILFINNYTRICTALIKRVVPAATAIIIAPAILVSGQNNSNVEPRFSTNFNAASRGNISDQKPEPTNNHANTISNNVEPRSASPKPLAFIPQPKAQVLDRSQYPVKVHIPSLQPPRDVEGIVNTAIAEWVKSADHKTYGFYADGIRQRNRVSCSSFIRNVIGNVNRHASEVGMSLPTRHLPYNSAALVAYVSEANKQAPRKLSSGKELLKLRPGDIVGVDSGVNKHKYDKGIDHILIIYRDTQSQKLMIAESTSRRDKKDGKTGVQSLSVEDYMVLLEKRRHWKFYVTHMTALLQETPDAIIVPDKKQTRTSRSKTAPSQAAVTEEPLIQKFRTANTPDSAVLSLAQGTNERRVAAILEGRGEQFEQAVPPPRM